jgi:3',5'-cyclic AMP phosphodiesterase CpdA
MLHSVVTVVVAVFAAVQLPQPLRLRADGTFSIIQIADVHTGEGEASWGPGVDARTYHDLGQVLAAEPNLDLAVFSGDMLTGLNVDANATAYWDRLVRVVDEAHLPHTAILGNHDAEPFSGTGANQSSPGAKTTRTELMRHDSGLQYSYSQVGPEVLRPAVSTYVVDIFPHAASTGEIPALQLFHLDSGGGGMPEEIYETQIRWFNETVRAKRKAHNDTAVPALVFVHIPVWEFQDAVKAGSHCFGDHSGDITPTAHNTGLFAALDAVPEVQAVFVGHNHCNDFCCQFGTRKVDLCFGRHSGYGGYTCDGYDPYLHIEHACTHTVSMLTILFYTPSLYSASRYDMGSRVITFHGATGVLETHVRMNKNLSAVHHGTLV